MILYLLFILLYSAPGFSGDGVVMFYCKNISEQKTIKMFESKTKKETIINFEKLVNDKRILLNGIELFEVIEYMEINNLKEINNYLNKLNNSSSICVNLYN